MSAELCRQAVLHYLTDHGLLNTRQALEEETQAVYDPLYFGKRTRVIESSLRTLTGGEPQRVLVLRNSLFEGRVNEPVLPHIVQSYPEVHSKNIIGCQAHPIRPWVGSVSVDRSVSITHLDSGESVARYNLKCVPLCLAFNPIFPELLVVGTMGGSVALYDMDKETSPQLIKDHGTKYVLRVLWSFDGTLLATASSDCTVNIYKLHENMLNRISTLYFMHTPEALVFTETHLVIAARGDNYLRFYELDEFSEVDKVNMNSVDDDFVSFTVLDLCFDKFRGFFAAVTDSNRVLLLHPSVSGPIQVYTGIISDELSVPRSTFSPDGKSLFCTSQDNGIMMWDVATCKPIGKLIGHTNLVRDLSYSGTNDILVTGSYDRSLRLWSL